MPREPGAFSMLLDGFEAVVTYDEATELFSGQVISPDAPIAFAGRTGDELRVAFRRAIDAYRAGTTDGDDPR